MWLDGRICEPTIMKVYKGAKIGRLIALGGEHVVYAYGTDQVIKFSLLFYFLGHRALAKAERDIELCSKYFSDYFLETDILISANGKHLVHVQEKIEGRPLTVNDVRDMTIRKQFDEIVVGYRSLIRAGHPEIDLIGRTGFFGSCFSNIFVTPQHTLVIIDGTLWEATGFLRPLVSLIRTIAIWRQDMVLKEFTSSVSP